MTNTAKVPSTTSGPVCGRCSHFGSTGRVQVRHADISSVQACHALGYAVQTLEQVAPAPVLEVPTPAQQVQLFQPEAKPMGRFSASCPKKGCKTSKVADKFFVLKCYHGGKVVRTKAKQLWGKASTAAKHACNDSCMYAVGATCVCSCAGVNHGLGLLVKLNG